MGLFSGAVGIVKHVVGHVLGLVAVLVVLSVAMQPVLDDGDMAVAFVAAALLWALHLVFTRTQVEQNRTWLGAVLRGMAWASRCGALILVPAAIYLLLFAGLATTWDGAPALWLAEQLDRPWISEHVDEQTRLGVAAVVCTSVAVVALGFLIEVAHGWAVVSMMARQSSPSKKGAAVLRRRRAVRRALKRRTYRARGRSSIGAEGRAVLARNRRFRAWGWAEFVVPIVATCVPVAIYAPDVFEAHDDMSALDLVVAMVLIWGAAALSKRFDLGTRTPFRQARLVFGTMFALLGAIFAGLLGLLAPIGIAGTSRAGHWALVGWFIDLVETLVASRHTFALFALLFLSEPLAPEPQLFGFDRGPAVIMIGLSAYLLTFLLLRVAKLAWLRLAQPVHLILLRVFGDSDSARFLVQRIAPSWHGIGNVAFIGAPDTAIFTLDVGDVAGVLFGQLRDRFIAGWEERDAAIDESLGRKHAGTSHDFLCFDDTWKPMLRRLLAVDAVVLMDLRAFGRSNAGCVFELENLMERVPLHRVMLLVDETTDRAFLDETLGRAWATMSHASPNAHASSGEIAIFDMDDDDRASHRLLEHLAEAAARAA